MLVGHVRHAFGVQLLDQGFHSSAKGMLPVRYVVVFQRQLHTIKIACTSDIHGSFGQFIDGSEIACEPMSAGQIETIAPCLEKCVT